MAFTKEQEYKVEVLHDKTLQVRRTDIIKESGVVVGTRHNRSVIVPGGSTAGEAEVVTKIAGLLHDTATVSGYYASGGGGYGNTLTQTYTVTAAGGKFYINGYVNPALTVNVGTYKFDLSDSSNAGQALKFSTTADGTHGGGTEYTTGVTSSGTAGSAGAYVQLVVDSSTPTTLYYYCGNHSGMGNSITKS